jgi:hypothetical protein
MRAKYTAGARITETAAQIRLFSPKKYLNLRGFYSHAQLQQQILSIVKNPQMSVKITGVRNALAGVVLRILIPQPPYFSATSTSYNIATRHLIHFQ